MSNQPEGDPCKDVAKGADSAQVKTFKIPAPNVDKDCEDASAAEALSFSLAFEEIRKNAKGDLRGKDMRDHKDWSLNRQLKLALFVFVLGLNCWWDVQIKEWIWLSGNSHPGFHLSDKVLIALATTSVANFLALIIIVAKHLFPSGHSKS